MVCAKASSDPGPAQLFCWTGIEEEDCSQCKQCVCSNLIGATVLEYKMDVGFPVGSSLGSLNKVVIF